MAKLILTKVRRHIEFNRDEYEAVRKRFTVFTMVQNHVIFTPHNFHNCLKNGVFDKLKFFFLRLMLLYLLRFIAVRVARSSEQILPNCCLKLAQSSPVSEGSPGKNRVLWGCNTHYPGKIPILGAKYKVRGRFDPLT